MKLLEYFAFFEDSLNEIDNYLFHKGNSFEIDHAPYTLKLRSGLQNVMDYLKDYERFQNILEHLADGIETLDEGIQHWLETGTVTDENASISPGELSRPNNVPVSHWWWYD